MCDDIVFVISCTGSFRNDKFLWDQCLKCRQYVDIIRHYQFTGCDDVFALKYPMMYIWCKFGASSSDLSRILCGQSRAYGQTGGWMDNLYHGIRGCAKTSSVLVSETSAFCGIFGKYLLQYYKHDMYSDEAIRKHRCHYSYQKCNQSFVPGIYPSKLGSLIIRRSLVWSSLKHTWSCYFATRQWYDLYITWENIKLDTGSWNYNGG